MIKQIGCTLLWAMSCLPVLTTPAYSEDITSQQGLNVEYELVPNVPQEFANHLFWTIDASCKVSTEDASDELYAEVLVKKGRLNDIDLTTGQCLSLTIHAGEVFKIYAESGSKVRITNLGEHSVRAACKA